jgi:hypothetical protein
MTQGRFFRSNVISAFLLFTSLLLRSDLLSAQTSWEHIGVGGGGYFSNVKIDPHDSDKIYAGSDVTGFFRSSDAGATWDASTIGLASFYVGEILLSEADEADGEEVIFVTTTTASPHSQTQTGGGVYKSIDGGESFVKVLEADANGSRAFFSLAADPINDDTIYAGQGFFRYEAATGYSQSKLYRSTNLGTSWEEIPLSTMANDYYGIHSIVPLPKDTNTGHTGADDLFISASTPIGVIKLHWNGSTWDKSTINGSVETGLPHPDARDLEATYSGGELNRLYVVLNSKWNPADLGSIYDRESGYGGGVWFTTNQGSTWHPTSVEDDEFDLATNPVKNMRTLAIKESTGAIYVTLSNGPWSHQGLWRATPGTGGPTDWSWQILTEHRIYSDPDGLFNGTPDENFNFERTYQPNLGGCEGLDINQATGDIIFVSSMHLWFCATGNCLPGNCQAGDCEGDPDPEPYWQALDTEKVADELQWRTTGMDDTQAFDITVDPEDAENWYLAQGDLGLYNSQDSGDSWTPCAPNPTIAEAYGGRNCWKILAVPALDQWIAVFGSWALGQFHVWWTTAPPSLNSAWTKIEFDPDDDHLINDVLVVDGKMVVATDDGVFKSEFDPFGAGAGEWDDLIEWGTEGGASQVVAGPIGPTGNRRFVAGFWDAGIKYATSFGGTWQGSTYDDNSGPEANCWDTIYSLEWSKANSNVIHAGSGNPHGCYLKSTNQGSNWAFVTDEFGDNPAGDLNVVDLFESASSPYDLHAAISPAMYEGSLPDVFGGVFYWSGSVWNDLLDGFDASHMTFIKEDQTTAGRFFAGTLGNGAYIYQDLGGGSERGLALDGKVELSQPSLHGVQLATSPASPSPSIRFSLAMEGRVTVSVYESTGRLVRSLFKEKFYAGGVQTVTWDGRDDSGHRAPSGVYYARVSTPINAETVKIVMLR